MKFDLAAERNLLLEHVHNLQTLESKEYTVRKKWDELQNKIHTDRLKVHLAQKFIWKPRNLFDEQLTIEDINALSPAIVICITKENKDWWDIFRRYASTAEYNTPPTRNIKYFIINRAVKIIPSDDFTYLPYGMVLGIGALSGDSHTLKPRDEFIGWTKEQRNKKGGMLRNIANVSTCVPTQPFGTNFRGGKLIAMLSTHSELRNHYQMKYNDCLYGMTTTSLDGRPSMYDGLKIKLDGKKENDWWWKPLGSSSGKMPVALDDVIYARWTKYLKANYRAEYDRCIDGRKSGPTLRVMALICRIAGIPVSKISHGHERGVYFSSFCENTKDILCGRINQSEFKPNPLFAFDISETEMIMNWWRPKAIEEYKEKLAKGGLNPDTLFYNHGYMKDWQTFRKKYLKIRHV